MNYSAYRNFSILIGYVEYRILRRSMANQSINTRNSEIYWDFHPVLKI